MAKTRNMTEVELWRVQHPDVRNLSLSKKHVIGFTISIIGFCVSCALIMVDLPYWGMGIMPLFIVGFWIIFSTPIIRKPMKGISGVITFEDENMDWDGKKGKELEAIRKAGKP